MKTLIKLILSILMPNFGIALIIRNTVRDSENENKILTRKEIEGLYFKSMLILLIPFIMLIASGFLHYVILVEWLALCFYGIFISVVFIFTAKDLKVEPNN